MRTALLLLAACLATALNTPAALAAPKAAASRKATPPAAPLPMRLPADVVPQAVTLAITLDPAQPTHRGTVEITLQLRAPTQRIRLHAQDLQLGPVWIEVGAQRLAGQVQRLDAESVAIQFPRKLPAGPAMLGMAFSGRLQDKDVTGLFRQQAGGRWMAATQFESVHARQAFPVFDEPGFKLPWTLRLTIPAGLTAVSNMPALTPADTGTEAPGQPEARNPALARLAPDPPGWKTVQFATTPPLPSYLLAFAVGEFDVVDAGSTGPESQTPVRVIAPLGRGAEAAYAARVTGPIVQRLEAYFGLPHPYPKLDNLALPLSVGFSAMEHPGLVTYGARWLLAAPADQTPAFERGYTSTAAHELAHQWFGNLVTLAWWDDLWLNESFASWLGDRITAELQPGWGWDTAALDARRNATRTDRLLSTRQIAEPVTDADSLASVWDSITYDKGQSVLAMLEHWLGPERFQAGVRRYMQRHAWGNATSADFSAALGAEDASLPAALRSFTHQPGIPRIAASLDCAGGTARLRLRQSRLLPLGSGRDTRPALWQVPMVLRTPAGLTRTLLTSAEGIVTLPDTPCPAWVQVNAGGLGYYRVAYGAGLPGLSALLAQPDLPLAERLSGLDDALGLAEAGDLPLTDMLDLAEANAGHADRRVVQAAANLLQAARPLVAPGQEAAYAARWQRALGERARQLGWQHGPDDADNQRQLRISLLPRLADAGDDADLRAQALALTRGWLQADANAPPVLDASLRAGVLASAAIDGDAALFDALRAALDRSTRPAERRDLLAALGHFRQPALAERARQLLLDPALDIRETRWPLLSPQNEHPAGRAGLLDFIRQNHARLALRLGRDEPGNLPQSLDLACSTDEARRIEALFAPLAPRYQGGRPALAQALESVRLCAAWAAAGR